MTAEVLWLDDPWATDVRMAGVEAASLAWATHAGLPVVPGFVLTVAGGESLASGRCRHLDARLQSAWALLTGEGAQPVVVRPSPVERTSAERRGHVLEAGGWGTFVATLERLVARERAGQPAGVAVLVQQRLDARHSGVVLCRNVPTVAADASPPSRRQVRALVRLARRVVRALGDRCDIEWAVDKAGIALLGIVPSATARA